MSDYTEKLTDSQAMGFIDQVGSVFSSLPHLPAGVVKFLVKIAPWMALLGAVLGFITGPIVGLLGSLGSLFSLSPLLLLITAIDVAIILLVSVLALIAFPLLKERKMKGWILMFWTETLYAVTLITSVLQGTTAGIVYGVGFLLLGYYILFEMRSSYGPVASAAKKVEEKVKDSQ